MIFLAQIDLASEQVEDIRSRLGEAEDGIGVHKQGPGLWTIYKNGRTATFKLLGTLSNGDRVFMVAAPEQARAYLENKLGARVRTWQWAATDTTPRAALGGVSTRDWLLARVRNSYTAQPGDPAGLDGAPLPDHVAAGQTPASALFEGV